jgi:hypothetical protein
MALAQTNLGAITQIQSGAAATVYVVGSAKTSYIKSFLIHSLNDSAVQNAEVHIVPNNGGAVGTASSVNRIAKLGIGTADTYFFECAYPITLVANNDTIQVKNTEGVDAINVIVLGDREG